ncbi:MAG: hypothetical protein RCG15_02325 [Candidatus Rickettsia vulgarisii]
MRSLLFTNSSLEAQEALKAKLATTETKDQKIIGSATEKVVRQRSQSPARDNSSFFKK